MRVILQRVSEAKVVVNKTIIGNIEKGFLVLVGFENEDAEEDIYYLIRKILNLRVFSDEEGKMNKSVKDINGKLLIVSQFTLYANTKKGNRPSFIQSAKPEIAIPLYERFIEELNKELPNKIQTGEFGAAMKVHLINDGPVTITIDSKNR